MVVGVGGMKSGLNWHELLQAAIVGSQRNVEALRHARPTTHGFSGAAWTIHIEGAAAEMAYAKARDVFWLSVVDDFHALPGDVGRTQVRSTDRANGCLLLHHEDPDNAAFVLAVGRAPEFDFVGWGIAGDLKRPEFWREDTGRPAFFVPQTALERG